MAAKRKRDRKRHVQQQLFRRGGKRRGAGRKSRGARAGEGHDTRPAFEPHHPLHVVMRVVPAVGSLRRRAMYTAMRDATITAALRERFRIVHVSLQRNHVHLLVEAEHKDALARGMQGFLISAYAVSRRTTRTFSALRTRSKTNWWIDCNSPSIL